MPVALGRYFPYPGSGARPYRYPAPSAQLYESAVNLLIFAILYRLFLREHPPGRVIALYLVLYGCARFIIEFFRNHERSLLLDLSITQWIFAGLAALGAYLLLRVNRPALAEA